MIVHFGFTRAMPKNGAEQRIPIKLLTHFKASDSGPARCGQYNRLCKAKAFEREGERGGKISVFFRVKLRP